MFNFSNFIILLLLLIYFSFNLIKAEIELKKACYSNYQPETFVNWFFNNRTIHYQICNLNPSPLRYISFMQIQFYLNNNNNNFVIIDQIYPLCPIGQRELCQLKELNYNKGNENINKLFCLINENLNAFQYSYEMIEHLNMTISLMDNDKHKLLFVC